MGDGYQFTIWLEPETEEQKKKNDRNLFFKKKIKNNLKGGKK